MLSIPLIGGSWRIDRGSEVIEDYRKRIVVGPDSPILAFKASRDRYINLPSQARYAGLP